jgi:hypothetical protein
MVFYSRWSLNAGIRVVVSEQSLKAGVLLIQVVSNAGLTYFEIKS